tara:strand:+ start:354 stop:512 length:159 start_codon:yes stop_codon:yes gene_type:complete
MFVYSKTMSQISRINFNITIKLLFVHFNLASSAAEYHLSANVYKGDYALPTK